MGPKAAVGPRAARWRPKMASKWVKIGLKRAFFRGTAKIRQKALVLPLGRICAGKKAPCALRWPFLETKCGCTPLFEVF